MLGRVLCLAVLSALTLGAGNAAPDPYVIYDQAESFWFSQSYPPYLEYHVAVEVREAAIARVERYASGFDAMDGAIWVDPVSDYEQAHPYVPHGINVSILGMNVGKPEPSIDFVGVPILTPTYSFGMAPFIAAAPPGSAESARQLVAAIRRAFHDPYPPGRAPPRSAAPNHLLEIAHAVVTRRIYDITLLGVEGVDGHDCYHLRLSPRQDPGRYRLRDLWVDEGSGATWRLREALNFVEGPGTTVPWTVRFDNIAGVQYVADESADAPLRSRGATYSSVVVRFEGLHAVTIPQWNPISITPQSNTLREPE
ncbi:MAG TPA: hypothetical protein VIN40_03750 [Candidatus Tyrphobacter sp.]